MELYLLPGVSERKESTRRVEMTEIEHYVMHRYHAGDYDWVPTGRSMTLEKYEKQESSEDADEKKLLLGFQNVSKELEELDKTLEKALNVQHPKKKEKFSHEKKSIKASLNSEKGSLGKDIKKSVVLDSEIAPEFLDPDKSSIKLTDKVAAKIVDDDDPFNV